eukprot:2069123-Amphidinium_carterae.1
MRLFRSRQAVDNIAWMPQECLQPTCLVTLRGISRKRAICSGVKELEDARSRAQEVHAQLAASRAECEALVLRKLMSCGMALL